MTTNLTPDVIAEIVRRLAMAFPVHMNSLGPNDTIRPDDVGMLLGIDSVENGGEVDEVGFLIKMGVLRGSATGRVAPADLLAFLSAHGHTWALGRMEMLRGELRNHLAGAGAADHGGADAED